MANRAYIVLRRNDLEDNYLQALDLIPNESLRVPNQEPYGQTHYLTNYLLDGVNNPVVSAAGVIVANTYGLSGYLKANIEDQAALAALTDAQAQGASVAIEALASAGSPLTAAAINAAIQAQPGVNVGTTLTAGNSTGSVEEILQILAGERYKVPAGAVVELAALFQAGTGFFVTAPNLVPTLTTGPGGKKSTQPVLLQTPPTQTGTEDVHFVNLRHIYNAGDLHRSALLGVLAKLKASTFTFLNGRFTYGTVPPGTALTMAGANIGLNGQAPAVAIYAKDGTTI